MVNLPENVDDWTIGTIMDILHEGYYETDILEFKEGLSTDNQRIARTSCAFTNTNGGYIIIGIDNDRTKNPINRILGVSKSEDNVVKVSDQIKNIIPEIPLEKIKFKKSPIPLHNGNEIIIIRVEKSDSLHQFEDKFYKRIQGKNDPMPYDEIKNRFIINKRINSALHILAMDLQNLREVLTLQTNIDPMIISTHMNFLELLEDDGIKFFLYNQSYLHNSEIQNKVMRLLTNISQLHAIRVYYHEIMSSNSEESRNRIAQKDNVKTFEESVAKDIKKFADRGIERINEIKELLNLKFNREKNENKDQNTSSNSKII